jgi:rRNA-processing protein FCF1
MTSKIILDTNFIITCIKQKIDFFEELKYMGFHIIIPKQVIDELVKLKRKLELKIVEKHKADYQLIRFKRGYVDKGMIEFAQKNPKAIIATLDSDLKNKILNSKMVIRGKKTLEVI